MTRWWGSDRDGPGDGDSRTSGDGGDPERGPPSGSDSNWERERSRLIEGLRSRGRVSERTLEALAAVPRHEFVPETHRQDAYVDRPLPIGQGQTISAPHMVAIMIERLELEPGQDVLEIGTGCGYHAAVTAEVVGPDHVYSVEYHQALAGQARDRLDELGYGDVSITVGDGHEGWPDHAPYDRAYLTCAAAAIPDAVVEQLRPGGVFLGPIGTARQTLVRAEKRPDGGLDREEFGGVRFVQMQGSDS